MKLSPEATAFDPEKVSAKLTKAFPLINYENEIGKLLILPKRRQSASVNIKFCIWRNAQTSHLQDKTLVVTAEA